jgi:hypothetical protein
MLVLENQRVSLGKKDGWKFGAFGRNVYFGRCERAHYLYLGNEHIICCWFDGPCGDHRILLILSIRIGRQKRILLLNKHV